MTSATAPLSTWLAGRSWVWRLGAVLAGSWLLAASAWVSVPMWPVPITLQTFALCLIAALSGPRLSVEIVAAYLVQGAAGLPVFAGGLGGAAYLLGPTGGYLAGFLVAAPAMALIVGRGAGLVRQSAAYLIGHAIVLALGFSWLAAQIGPQKAFITGVAPFLIGSAIKAVMAVATVKVVQPMLKAAD